MAQTVEFDLKQIRPAERHLRPARSAADAGGDRPRLLAIRRPPRRGRRTAEPRGAYAGQPRPAGRLPVSVGPVLSGDRGAQAGRRRRDGPLLPGQVPFRPAGIPGGARRATRRPRRPATTRASAPWAGPRRSATPTIPPAALAVLDSLSGAIEQTAEYLAQRAATVAALGGNPQEVVALYERAVEADRNHPGALFGLALENDRHGNDDTAMELYKRAVEPLSRPHRLAGEPRPALRRPRAVRQGRPVLPPRAGRVSRPSPGGAVLQGHRGVARAVLRRRRRRRNATGWARCSASRSPISSFRSAAATACKRWAS